MRVKWKREDWRESGEERRPEKGKGGMVGKREVELERGSEKRREERRVQCSRE